MIFDDLDAIAALSPADRLKRLGKQSKSTSTVRLHRSNMMLNPLNLKHLNRIDEGLADVITLNLEDAIAPSRKREALYNIALFLSHLDSSPSKIVIRTNPIDEGGAEEIRFLNDFGFDAIRLSKVKTPQDIQRALAILGDEKELHISLETKEAFADIGSLKIDDRLTTANLGILDLLASIGLPQSLLKIGNPTIDYILSRFIIDSMSAGIHPVSFMFQDYKDIETFRQWCEYERDLGFVSKACMGPAQVDVANEIFGISEEALSRAKHIKKVFEENAAKGINGFMDEKYGFIDEPIYKDALLVLSG